MDEILLKLLENEQLALILVTTFAIILSLIALMIMIAVVFQNRQLEFGRLKISGRDPPKSNRKEYRPKKYRKEKKNTTQIIVIVPGKDMEVSSTPIITLQTEQIIEGLQVEAKSYRKKRVENMR